MGGLADLIKEKDSPTKTARVVGVRKNGMMVVRLNSVDYSVKNAVNVKVRNGDSVILNKTEQGKYYIAGISEGFSNSTTIKEIYRDG